MELVHCIYCSAAVDENFSRDDLKCLLDQSRANNAGIGVTGILLFRNGSFFQVLEGDRETVTELYSRISRDPRHTHVTKIILEPIDERAFGDWTMGYPSISDREFREIPGLNDFFVAGRSFHELGAGRARTLISAFQKGRWNPALA